MRPGVGLLPTDTRSPREGKRMTTDTPKAAEAAMTPEQLAVARALAGVDTHPPDSAALQRSHRELLADRDFLAGELAPMLESAANIGNIEGFETGSPSVDALLGAGSSLMITALRAHPKAENGVRVDVQVNAPDGERHACVFAQWGRNPAMDVVGHMMEKAEAEADRDRYAEEVERLRALNLEDLRRPPLDRVRRLVGNFMGPFDKLSPDVIRAMFELAIAEREARS